MHSITSATALQLLRAVMLSAGCDALDREKPIIVTEWLETQDWASVTFEGELHHLHLRIDGESAAAAAMLDRLRRQLPEQEIALKGWFVADITVEDRQDCDDHDDSLGKFPINVNQNATFSSHSFIIRALVLRD